MSVNDFAADVNILVSVVMSVRNEGEFIRQAIDSVLNQTMADFELLIVDDASVDDTPEILKSYTDPRIKVYYNKTVKGIPTNCNFLMKMAKGKYIARFDGDDICRPDRLEKEISILEERQDIYLVCSNIRTFGELEEVRKTECDFEKLKTKLILRNPIAQSTVMFRNDKTYYYDEWYSKSQDYELWSQMMFDNKIFYVIDEELVYYRIHTKQISRIKDGEEDIFTKRILAENLSRICGNQPREIVANYARVIRREKNLSMQAYFDACDMLKKIYKCSRHNQLFDNYFLKKTVKEELIETVILCGKTHGLWSVIIAIKYASMIRYDIFIRRIWTFLKGILKTNSR